MCQFKIGVVGLCATACLYLPTPDGTAAEQAESATEIEDKVLDYRRNRLMTGRVVLKKRSTEGVRDNEFEYHIVFDHERIRFDWRGRVTGADEWGPFHKHVVTPAYYIVAYPNGTVVSKAGSHEYEDVRKHYQIFHPRSLATNVNGTTVLAREGLTSILGRTDRSRPRVFKEVIDGESLLRIDYTKLSSKLKPNVSAWVSPSKGYGIVRAESVAPDGERSLQFTMTAKLQCYSKHKLWYPSSVEYQFVRNGEVVRRELVTVVELKVLELVDDAVFDISGMDIEPGRYISDRTGPKAVLFLWNGQKAIRATPPPVEDDSNSAKEEGRSTESGL